MNAGKWQAYIRLEISVIAEISLRHNVYNRIRNFSTFEMKIFHFRKFLGLQWINFYILSISTLTFNSETKNAGAPNTLKFSRFLAYFNIIHHAFSSSFTAEFLKTFIITKWTVARRVESRDRANTAFKKLKLWLVWQKCRQTWQAWEKKCFAQEFVSLPASELFFSLMLISFPTVIPEPHLVTCSS